VALAVALGGGKAINDHTNLGRIINDKLFAVSDSFYQWGNPSCLPGHFGDACKIAGDPSIALPNMGFILFDEFLVFPDLLRNGRRGAARSPKLSVAIILRFPETQVDRTTNFFEAGDVYSLRRSSSCMYGGATLLFVRVFLLCLFAQSNL
jgi:hypothetical protein